MSDPGRGRGCGRGCGLAALGWVVGLVCALIAWPVLSVVEESTRRAELVWETCEREDPTASTPDGTPLKDGVCVRHERLDRVIGDDVDQVVFHTWKDGTQHPRFTYRGWPLGAGQDGGEVTFGPEEITVTDGEGVSATYSRGEIAPD